MATGLTSRGLGDECGLGRDPQLHRMATGPAQTHVLYGQELHASAGSQRHRKESPLSFFGQQQRAVVAEVQCYLPGHPEAGACKARTACSTETGDGGRYRAGGTRPSYAPSRGVSPATTLRRGLGRVGRISRLTLPLA